MKIAITSVYDSRDVREWSGLPYHISKCLAAQGAELKYYCPLTVADNRNARIILRIKHWIHRRLLKKEMFTDKDPGVLRGFARQLQRRLREDPVDIVFAISPVPIAALKADVPVCFWSDGTCAALRNFYPEYDRLSAMSWHYWHRMENLALRNADLAIYASRWAAQSAHEEYGCPQDKIEVMPFGANLDDIPSREQVESAISSRTVETCKLLFVGKDWLRKGGDVVLETARQMRERGIPTEVHLVGSRPSPGEQVPPFVIDHGFLCKTDPVHRLMLRELLLKSLFLFVPSTAECFGVVYCEAAAHGLPSIARAVGGTPDAVLDGHSGKLVDPAASPQVFADVLASYFFDRGAYNALALSSRDHYEQALNWSVIGQRTILRLEDLLAAKALRPSKGQ